MSMVVTLFLALAATIIGYAWLGQGGPVAGLVFLGIMLIGGVIRTFAPGAQSNS